MVSLITCFALLALTLITSTSCSKERSETNSISLNVSSKDQKEKDYPKREPSIKGRALPEQPLGGRVDSPNDSGEKVVSVGRAVMAMVAVANSGTTPPSGDVPDCQKLRYKSLTIVCSICSVIVLSIGLTVLYIHCKRGNNLSQEYANREGFQLSTVSHQVNLDLDLMSGTHYLNRRVQAFNDIGARIVISRENINTSNRSNSSNSKLI